MSRRAVYKAWAIYFGVALICQTAIPGSFRIGFFAFPVNAALLLTGGVSLWILYREKPNTYLIRILTAPATTFLLVAVALVTFLVLGLASWLTPVSWWFFFVLTALMAHLLVVTFRGLRQGRRHRLRFLLNHVGLLLAFAGGFAGGADTERWRLRVACGQATQEVFALDGSSIRLRQALELEKFTVTYYSGGIPESYEARIKVDDKDIVLRVNRPYGLSLTDDLYLVDYERRPAGEPVKYCILEIVRQPWKYIQRIGIWMMIAGAVLLFAQGLPQSANERKTT